MGPRFYRWTSAFLFMAILVSPGCRDSLHEKSDGSEDTSESIKTLLTALVVRGDEAAVDNRTIDAYCIYRVAGFYAPDDVSIQQKVEKMEEKNRLAVNKTVQNDSAQALSQVAKTIGNVDSKDFKNWPTPEQCSPKLELQLLSDVKLTGNLNEITMTSPPLDEVFVFTEVPDYSRSQLFSKYGKPVQQKTDADGVTFLTYGRVRVYFGKNDKAIGVLFHPPTPQAVAKKFSLPKAVAETERFLKQPEDSSPAANEKKNSGKRKWTDITGKFSIEATFVEVKKGQALLRKPDGRFVAIPLSRLSGADRQYVDSLHKNEAAEPKASSHANNSSCLSEEIQSRIKKNLQTFAGRLDAVAKTMGQDPKVSSDMRKWRSTLEGKAKETVPDMQLVFILTKVESFYNGNDLQPAAIPKQTNRAKQVPDEFVPKFQKAIQSASSNSKVSAFACMLFVVETDRLFKQGASGEVFDDKASRQLLSRLDQLPKAVVKEFSEKVHMDKADAAVFLAQLDSLFKNSVFQKEIFQKGLESALEEKDKNGTK